MSTADSRPGGATDALVERLFTATIDTLELASVHIAAINRPVFVNQLAGWLASIPEVDARLRAPPPARVADLVCGSARSSIALARAYPEVMIDADAESIEDARRTVMAAGLADQVRPVVHDASDPELAGR